MAKVKTKINLKKFDDFKKSAYTQLSKDIAQEIVNEIDKGISPVRGAGKYEKYSEKYIKQKAKIRKSKFVNLFLTGQMLKSLKAEIRNNVLEFFFTDKKAAYHDSGEGNLPQRKILPTRQGEQFNTKISKRIKEIIDDVASKFF